jgi:hypothetical protein
VSIVGVLLRVELLWKVLCRNRVIIQWVILKLGGATVHNVWSRVVMDEGLVRWGESGVDGNMGCLSHKLIFY